MGKGTTPSYRHLYIPQFYLNYYKTVEGYLHGYNKENAHFFKTQPKDVYFEENRNTFLNDENEESRWIEQVYSKLEAQFSAVLRKFNQIGNLTIEERRILLLFAYTTKWRSPAYDESFEYSQKILSFSDLRLHYVNKYFGIEYDLEKIWTSEEMQASKRILLAIQPFIYKEDYKDICKNLIFIATPEPYNAIIGSCPFVENPSNPDVVFESFIIPITPDYSLLYLHNGDINKFSKFWNDNYETVMPCIANLRDLSIYHISEKI